jgi:hypothetical protein
MNEVKSIKRKSIILRILKIVLFFLLGLIILVSITTFIIYLKKDDIGRELLLSVNSSTNGELEFDEIDVAPFASFPNVSLSLINPKYFEVPGARQDSIHEPILRFSKIFVSFDILELIRNNIDVSGIRIQDGHINLVEYEDSTFNFQRAFQLNPPEEKQIDQVRGSMFSLDDLLLSIDLVTLRNIDIDILRMVPDRHHKAKINKSKASLQIKEDSIQAKLDMDIDIEKVILTEKINLKDEHMTWKADLSYYIQSNGFKINKSELGLGKAVFELVGDVQFDDQGFIDLEIEANDESMRFTKLIFTSEGIDNLKNGELYFNGSIHGPLRYSQPEILINFGISDMTVTIPNSNKTIDNLKMSGYFNSGKERDLSKALFRMDTLTGMMPNGHIRASLDVRNFSAPSLKYKADIRTNIDDLDKIFDIKPFENIQGDITIRNDYSGYLKADGEWADLKQEDMFIKFDSISLNIIDVMDIKTLDGSVSGAPDSIYVNNLYLETGNSDLSANGVINNISNLILDRGLPVEADLRLRSQTYDFFEFWTFLPKVAQSFPYAIKDAYLDVFFSSTYEKLSDFIDVPEMDFDIRHLEGSVTDLLPWTELKYGHFKMSEQDSVSILDFSDFTIESARGKVDTDFKYYITQGNDDSLKLTMDIKNLNPSRIIQYEEKDTIPEILDAFIDGKVHCDLSLPVDSLIKIKSLYLEAEEFVYTTKEDTSQIRFLELSMHDINFGKLSPPEVFSTLTAQSKLVADGLKTPLFQLEELKLSLNVEQGVYTLIPLESQFYGKEEKGRLVIQPFAEPPEYHVDYTIQEFPIEEFMSAFYSQPILTGNVNLHLNLDFKGEEKQTIISQINGKIDVNGKNLTLHGINIDEFINNFRRSQQFNLLDLGAVALAGPAGILFSKGSDYAMILASRSGEKTTISQVSSLWNVEDGKISIEDVAFATLENRMAAKGWMDMKSDSLDVTVAIVDVNGCSMINQNIYGHSKDPQFSQVKILKTLFAPVTKLLNNITATECETFYEGRVEHPEKAKGNPPEE